MLRRLCAWICGPHVEWLPADHDFSREWWKQYEQRQARIDYHGPRWNWDALKPAKEEE